ncbi:MAG: tripartite tricarboxylate transporter substrate binding protein [Desulfuromonadales bacterium]|nr:tripartite tricarboxylate transporter substrate binding protein [Desulfuromonadales bacterium]
MIKVKGITLLFMLSTVILLNVNTRVEAAWPNDQPITMIVAFSPGGSTDVAARLAAVYIEKYLGQSVVVLNRPGAGGEVGFTALAEAKPDGYTIGFINSPNVLTIPMQRQTRYSLESFIPVAQVMDDPDSFFVLKKSPLNNISDLVELAKSRPGRVSYGTSGIGSDDHIAAELLILATGIKMRHIPFDGAAASRTATLGNHVDVGVFNISEGKEYVVNGQLKILGQMSEDRTELFPDTPTFREQGFDILMSSTRGIAMPVGTPDDIVQRFAEATEKAVNDPEFKKRAEEASLPLRFLGPQDYLKSLQNNRDKFQQLWNTSPWIQQK